MSRANPVKITPKQSRELAEIATECNNEYIKYIKSKRKKKPTIEPGIYHFHFEGYVYVVQINQDYSWEIISDTESVTKELRDEGYHLVGK